MEASRRRVLQKHLEPARPLRRCNNVDPPEPSKNDSYAQVQAEILQLNKQKKGKICYTRDFLIGLASCPVAKRKPEFLPEHPIVLENARDPGPLTPQDLTLQDLTCSENKTVA
ncbi:uncharacterized protein C8orf88 homolog [Lampris incognitus]|uniref:uncharacterized protein C8orf88 homolog n=1 Tax=Lampris incognitus TaxID=2546036 RepID=UPI0024B4E620|nr:uncharacterized protein C8orf88 homolog [Lampris incognitus]